MALWNLNVPHPVRDPSVVQSLSESPTLTRVPMGPQQHRPGRELWHPANLPTNCLGVAMGERLLVTLCRSSLGMCIAIYTLYTMFISIYICTMFISICIYIYIYYNHASQWSKDQTAEGLQVLSSSDEGLLQWGYPQSSSFLIGISPRDHPAIGVPPWRAGNPQIFWKTKMGADFAGFTCEVDIYIIYHI